MFENECAIALQLGMTYEQYWYGDIDAMVSFALFYKQKRRAEFITNDMNAWLAGQYSLVAFAKVMSDSFSKKGSPSRVKYPEEPMYTTAFDERAKLKKEEREVKKSYNNFMATVRAMGMSIQGVD